jgi:hypothetical protein
LPITLAKNARQVSWKGIDGIRVAIYTSVSTDAKGESTENQKTALQAWARNAGQAIANT